MKPRLVMRSLTATAVIAALGAGAFSAGHWLPREASAAAAPVTRASTPNANTPVVGALLPDFTGIVQQNGPAVVNISVTQKPKADARVQQFGNIDPNNPLF